ncbi:LINE-1 retrotransposable element ORF1 protein [Frankliniella fusca]|uniref:LINE-1 retrotransposable element ORF1 protein n=1 Tax=Frankliniella fusca TaxID=407009 RepID=A0AAE1LQG9_9NEOP|nr:LINE-1 retrotransposable element ORF1 protein [Frankliniella fusca]
MSPPHTRSNDQNKVGDMSKKDLLSLITQALDPLKGSVDSLRSEVEGLNSQLAEKDKVIHALSERLNECEQYSRRNNLRIFGVAESADEDTDAIVLKVASDIGAHLSVHQIDRSHRVGKAGTNPRPIIVKFTGYHPRRAMFQAKKALKGSAVTIREDLTQQRLALLKKAIEAYSIKNVWTSDGVIMVNTGTKRPNRVKTSSDLDKLLERHPPKQEL